MRDTVFDTLMPLGIALGAALLALLAVHIVHRVLLRAGRRSALATELAERAHRPTQWVVVLCAVYFSVRSAADEASWRHAFLHADQLIIIGAAAWLVAALLVVAEDAALARFRTDVPDNRNARRVHTQVVMIRRVTVAVVAVLAGAVMLMTFPQARIVGTSVLASAGFAGVIAGLAAQSVLRNMFAGLQLAFSDAVRLGDVVIVEQEWGRVQEITLSYVVVHVWDDRRLILPTSYFTEKPFENWTRSESALLGAVMFDVDWWLPVPEMREELRRALESTDLWDGRVSVLQVVEATGSAMQLRALVSAEDAPKLWDLRCFVREHLVTWLRDTHPAALPRVRAEMTSAMPLHATLTGQTLTTDGDSRVFSHSVDGRARAEAFTGPES
ncbi:mechanosensitive ion channel family protein [Dactylosporangium matsuzakiense]|uniref:Mechanosensitive ion channel protein MscS n=1 Tax=Dactylosporangium matsuzakiense TaxID=53360 RepID=A0A9W6NLE9_9ACTN|nr:mechanosensitive ion channel family protein [Dactylosporangium matsuzakiense]GLL01289.1 mechanosensitive ion channel protein MscS [Dactylosporangium matsuzakiense]